MNTVTKYDELKLVVENVIANELFARPVLCTRAPEILTLLQSLSDITFDLEEKRIELRGANRLSADLLARAEKAERERDEALAAAAVLGEALKPFGESVMDGPGGWEISTADPCEEDWITAHKLTALTSLPAAAKALLERQRTPGTVEMCPLCRASSYPPFKKDCAQTMCPIIRAVKEA